MSAFAGELFSQNALPENASVTAVDRKKGELLYMSGSNLTRAPPSMLGSLIREVCYSISGGDSA